MKGKFMQFPSFIEENSDFDRNVNRWNINLFNFDF